MGKSYRPIVVQTESFASQLLPQYPVFFAEVIDRVAVGPNNRQRKPGAVETGQGSGALGQRSTERRENAPRLSPRSGSHKINKLPRSETDRVTLISDELYLGLDGTGVPMRASELFGRKGKQPDGSAKNGKPDEIYRRAGFDLSGLREKLLACIR